jgi:hypothetical protein
MARDFSEFLMQGMDDRMIAAYRPRQNTYGNERGGDTMKLTFIGTTSPGGSCPSLYETDDGRIVVQGALLTDAEALAQLRDVLGDESAVVVPRALLTNFAPKE